MVYGKPAIAGFMFFCLDTKEPKSQDKPDPSGRFAGHFRTWVMIFLAVIVLTVIFLVEEDPSLRFGMTAATSQQ